jgi:hypothetical protein
MTYVKFRFTSRHGSTAGLIIETRKLEQMSVREVSRLFPYYEAGKMKRLQVSPQYQTWEEAFNHTF